MARDLDSYIFRKGVTPNTLSVISSKNRIFAFDSNGDNKQIGVVATFDPSESRTVEPIRGIGFGDHVAELVPGVTDPMTISVTRTALYLSNIMQAFGYKAGIDGITRSLKHHRWPFDIRQEIVLSTIAKKLYATTTNTLAIPTETQSGPGNSDTQSGTIGLVTLYEACWMSDYSVSFASDTAIVQETVTINVSDILSGDPNILSKYNATDDTLYSSLSTVGKGLSSRFAAIMGS